MNFLGKSWPLSRKSSKQINVAEKCNDDESSKLIVRPILIKINFWARLSSKPNKSKLMSCPLCHLARDYCSWNVPRSVRCQSFTNTSNDLIITRFFHFYSHWTWCGTFQRIIIFNYGEKCKSDDTLELTHIKQMTRHPKICRLFSPKNRSEHLFMMTHSNA